MTSITFTLEIPQSNWPNFQKTFLRCLYIFHNFKELTFKFWSQNPTEFLIDAQ